MFFTHFLFFRLPGHCQACVTKVTRLVEAPRVFGDGLADSILIAIGLAADLIPLINLYLAFAVLDPLPDPAVDQEEEI